MLLTKTKRRVLFWISVLLFLLIAPPAILYSLGYGLGRGFEIQKTGGVFIRASQIADVYVEKKHKKTSLISNGALIKNLVPGSYAVRVTKENFWDWQKTLGVMSEHVTSRSALLVPLNIDGKALGTSTPFVEPGRRPAFTGVKKFWALPKSGDFLILGEDGNFYKNKDLPAGKAGKFDFEDWPKASSTLRQIFKTQKNIVFGQTEEKILFWDEHNVYAFWIGDLNKMPEWWFEKLQIDSGLVFLHVYFSPNKIRGVAEYPGWPDYLLVEMQNGIFALEMDSTGGQNIFPIYKGKEPHIVAVTKNVLTILDDKNYTEIELP